MFFQVSAPVSTVTVVRIDVALATTAVPVSVSAADFNGDARQDLAMVDNANRLVSVLIGNGDGTFQTHVDYAVGTHQRSVAVVDVNRDGIPDLSVANHADSTVSVLLGSPAAPGTFTAASTFATGANPTYLPVISTGTETSTSRLPTASAVFQFFSGLGQATSRRMSSIQPAICSFQPSLK